ncbi:D-alanyl-D-alanine carboxypeptidase [Echinicola marina]|uniref:D-alanyl-D-alanine carboxypeptidase/D-alanyl-D-alanine-endopeptidase n=1 Tax=Echinicola marina TaxID=2859768 RepID=UPI001CF6E627|nr:D-alanyl-D-alanine carboxypeptidase [Echinicola marina]UCS93151.1 D-alanyl-D-alanine carboxypeptidase [Echinicola marina]
MRKLIFAAIIFCASCTVQQVKKSVRDSEVFDQGFTGFMLYDPAKDKVLYALNEDKYFTPASNTKMFTFYAAYKVLGERVNSLDYLVSGDSLVFWGTGDPSLLHPDFEDSSVVDLLGKTDKKLFMANNFDEVTAYGSGWSWNWYNYYYGPERSAMPIYGNIIRFIKTTEEKEMAYTPSFFTQHIIENKKLSAMDYSIIRDKNRNEFSYYLKNASSEFETDKPFVTSAELTAEMLGDRLNRDIKLIDYTPFKNRPHEKLKGIAADSLYKQMLKISDNFLAEQLMVLVADELFDSLDMGEAIDYVKKEYLMDLPDAPQWVDGSGLSSHNKFTPRSIIKLLEKIRAEVPEDKIYAYFPSGGESGTIRSWYKSDDEHPYVYAKTGTLSGVHCLSGYLLTKSGKTLYFSFMHNNYLISSNELKKEMEKILYHIHSKY